MTRSMPWTGHALSKEALASVGVVPGGVVHVDGLDYPWPDVAEPGNENLEVAGQTIALPPYEGAKKIGLLATAIKGPADTVATVMYTNGSTVDTPLSISDWTFTPGIDREYTATMAANVVSTAGDAALTVSDPGHLMNGAFALPESLRVDLAPASWTGPVSNASVAITFRQHIGTTDALWTGSYAKTLTLTLSTTAP